MKLNSYLNLLIFLFFISCDKNISQAKKQYFPSGELKSEIIMLNDSVIEYNEYYKSGEVFIRKKKFTDFYYKFYKNGIVKSKHEYRVGKNFIWDESYDTKGNIVSKIQYYRKNINNDSIYENQKIYFDENGKIITKKSIYFEFLNDTIKLGRNVVNIRLYDASIDTIANTIPHRFIKFIIKNRYSRDSIKEDAFYFKESDYNNGILTAWIGVYAKEKGEMILDGIIDDEIYFKNPISKDSLETISIRKKKYFSKVFYVVENNSDKNGNGTD